MFRRAKKGLLNNDNIAIFNNKVAVTIFIYNADKQVVIIQ